jgi:uncharacterized protein YecE (DUF72 family)
VKQVRIGCSGWNYADWRGRLYPQGTPPRRWLSVYAQQFDTVEVNSTFYRLARREAVANWVRETSEEFEFSVKASRYLTHVKRLTDLDRGFQRFYEPLTPLIDAGRLGPVLWQLPENFHRDDERLRAWLDALPEGRHTIEFRHSSWFTDEVLEALRWFGVALTIGDHPRRPFQLQVPTTDWWFVRFHWGARGRRGNYSASELEGWAERIAAWRREREVYAYFNNDWEGFAPANARLLSRRVEALSGPLQGSEDNRGRDFQRALGKRAL